MFNVFITPPTRQEDRLHALHYSIAKIIRRILQIMCLPKLQRAQKQILPFHKKELQPRCDCNFTYLSFIWVFTTKNSAENTITNKTAFPKSLSAGARF